MSLTSIEICAGGGGQALGLEQAGFEHVALVEIDEPSRATLRLNRPTWNVADEGNVLRFDALPYRGEVGLLAGGVPCPPFSKAGKQLGSRDERDLFPRALELVEACEPSAVLLENVRGLLDPVFDEYRERLTARLRRMGYRVFWKLLNACDYGVPQLRPRTLLVAIDESLADGFEWPQLSGKRSPTVGEALHEMMASGGWERADDWSAAANEIAPTLVGGSKKHGGPDLGPTRSKQAWAKLGVDGLGLANDPPAPGFEGMPRLTVAMTAVLQGFPAEWEFFGGKTASYRQVGNAFPPPVAKAVGESIAKALKRQPLYEAA